MELTEPDQTEYASIIHRSGSQLLQIINEILDLAKIESGDMPCNIQPTLLAELLEHCNARHQRAAEQKGLDYKVSIAENVPADFSTDQARLQQILNNLLGNAVKFTTEGSVHLDVSATDQNISFAVHDTGCGIPEESRESIFEKFHQLENFLTREHGGTGLGLAMAKRLAELLGGDITLVSEVDVGTTFTLTLPLNAPTTGENAPQ